MAGHGAGRQERVREWITQRAEELGVPVSPEVLCDTAVTRLEVSGVAVVVDTSRGWSDLRNSTDRLGGLLAELQVTVGEGPCIDATRTGGPILVADLDLPGSQRRWPLFTPLAVEIGVRAVFALPLRVGAIRCGTLVLHRTGTGPLDREALADSLAFAGVALRLLLDEQAGLPATDDPGGLPLHNPQLHQATGMVAAQLDSGMDDAFARLRGRAFATRRPLAELAADVVAGRVRFDPTQEKT